LAPGGCELIEALGSLKEWEGLRRRVKPARASGWQSGPVRSVQVKYRSKVPEAKGRTPFRFEEEVRAVNRGSYPLRILLLTAVSVFAVASIAGAGAVFRGRGNRDGKRGSSSSVERPSAPADRGRSHSYTPSTPADRGGSHSYTPSERRESAGGYRRSEGTNSRGPTMRDRTIDATPSYTRPDRDRSSANDRSRNSGYAGRNRGSDDSKFRRVGERPRYDSGRVVSYRPPRHSGGFYYYDCGWPAYRNVPLRYGYWYFEAVPHYTLRSVYCYYDYFPFIPVARVIIIHRPVIAYVEVPIVIHEEVYETDDYYLEARGTNSLDHALSDIRSAWKLGDSDLLLRHVRSDIRIDVLLDRSYAYSVNSDDYEDMTRDAVRSTDTTDFDWYSVRGRGDDRVIAYAKHKFYNPSGERKVVYVSYLLERRGGEWVITEVGSSLKRLG